MKYAGIVKSTGIVLFIWGGLSIVRRVQAILIVPESDSNAISRASAGCLIGMLLCFLGGNLFNWAKRL